MEYKDLGEYVLIHGTPQSSLSLAMSKLCIVVGRLLGEFVVGWLAVGSSPLTRTIAGYTQTASVPIRALSGEYVLICCGTPQSSLLLAMSELCIVIGRLLGDVVGWLVVGSSPLTGTIVGCTGTVSLPIDALSGEYVLLHGTPQLSLSLGMCELCIVPSFLGFRRIDRSLIKTN